MIAPGVSTVLDEAFRAPAEDADLVAAVAQAAAQGWPDVASHLENVQSHPTDTHPSTAERIWRLDIALDDTLLATALRPPGNGDASAGALLIDDWRDLCRTISRDYVAEAREAHERHRLMLEATAAAVPQETARLYNNVGPMIVLLIVMAAIFAAAGAAIWIWRQRLGFAHDGFALG